MFFYILVFIIILYVFFIKGKRGIQILQESSYNLNHNYFKWLITNFGLAFYHLDIIATILIIIAMYLNNKWSILLVILGSVIELLDTEMIKYKEMLDPMHKKNIYTKRLVLIIATIYLIFLIPFSFFIINPSY